MISAARVCPADESNMLVRKNRMEPADSGTMDKRCSTIPHRISTKGCSLDESEWKVQPREHRIPIVALRKIDPSHNIRARDGPKADAGIGLVLRESPVSE